MRKTHLQGAGRLGLVAALDALLETRSVSAAAARCGLTQSGMSHALATLRRTLGDDLLVRSGNRMHLTPRAASMAPGLRRGLIEIERALGGDAIFEPARSDRLLRIGTSDAAAVALMPRLMTRVRRGAPGLRFDVVPLHLIDAPELLGTGELDLLITASVPDRPGLQRAALYRDRFVCALRRGHPALRRRLDLDAYLRLDHVLVTTTGHGQGPVDQALESLGVARRIALRVGYFLAAPLVAAESDLAVTIPSGIMAGLGGGYGGLRLAQRPLPFEVPCGLISLVWHERFKNEPASRWLRGELLAVASGLGGGRAP